ncbi:MAG: PepSY-like domain-containing protein [Bacteroidales bacterium]
MKKILFTCTLLFSLISFSFAEKKSNIITFKQLPDSIQVFMNTHFKNDPVQKIKVNAREYKITFTNYDEIEFSKQNNQWIDMEIEKGIPASILETLPNRILYWLVAYHPGIPVVELQRLANGFFAMELTTGQELLFNQEGVFVETQYGDGLNYPDPKPMYP